MPSYRAVVRTDRAVINICFHGIGRAQRELEPGEARYWVTPDQYLRTLDEIMSWETKVAISFDDGNASDSALGVPALQERGLTASFFVLAGRLGLDGSLDEDAVRGLRDAGMVVGTHGMAHRPWRRLDAEGQRSELIDARARLAEVVGAPIGQAALPLGRYDRSVLTTLRRLGYTRVHTSDRRMAREGAWLQHRFSVRADDTIESLRSTVLAAPSMTQRLRSSAVGIAKRLR
jgi:peptidoglycan/xylan/chitin deacetylase (PgdA/CDA1 family)